MLTRIRQHLSNIWSSIYEKVKQPWGTEAELKENVENRRDAASWVIFLGICCRFPVS